MSPAFDYMDLHQRFDPPFVSFDDAVLGPAFADELATVSSLWFACGYRPGIAAYLNFFLLRELIQQHDAAFPRRFRTFRSMADSFYQTDLFIRAVTDSGPLATGGISNPAVRKLLKGIMQRHQRLGIPNWMMSYFGFSLVENVEKQCEPLANQQKALHLGYMNKAFRIMGVAFSEDRPLLQEFARAIERKQAGSSSDAERHARHILELGEMIGVSSRMDSISPMLPEPTRVVLAEMYPRVRLGAMRVLTARMLGKLVMKRAIGGPRATSPIRGPHNTAR